MPEVKNRVKRIEDMLEDSIGALEALLAPSPIKARGSVFADLMHRASESSIIDGYGASTGGEAVSGGGVSDPTAGTVVARESDVCTRCEGTGRYELMDGRHVTCRSCNGSGRRWADPLKDAVEEIIVRIGHIHRAIKIIDRRRELVMGAQAALAGRQSSLGGYCEICGDAVLGVGNDRLRRGLDPKCFLSWSSWKLDHATKDPGSDFLRFKKWRLERLKESKDEASEDWRVEMISELQGKGELPNGRNG